VAGRGVVPVMATYFDNFHSVFVRIVPDFSLLKVHRHKTDPRAATSVVIAGMTLGLAVMLAVSIGAPVRLSTPSKSGGVVAPPPAADKVTIVAATPRLDVPNLDVPCAEQTWPYIDRRCLTETTQKRPQPEARPADIAAATPPIDARSATAPVIPAVNPASPPASETPRTATTPAMRPDATEMPERRAANAYDIVQDDLDEEVEASPPMPPREQFRRERRRVDDPTRHIVRQLRGIFVPRF
jgi:hypothetical protein